MERENIDLFIKNNNQEPNTKVPTSKENIFKPNFNESLYYTGYPLNTYKALQYKIYSHPSLGKIITSLELNTQINKEQNNLMEANMKSKSEEDAEKDGSQFKMARSGFEDLVLTDKKPKLPKRLVVSNPFFYKSLESYGFIAYCLDTQKWLCVKRFRSAGYILTMRGSYREAEISILLKDFSVTERNTLLHILESEKCDEFPNYYIKDFVHNSDKSIPKTILDTINYSRERLIRYREVFLDILNKTKPLSDTEWMWPKGRLNGTTEKPLDCAIREFYEETGIRITDRKYENNFIINSTSILEKYQGLTGRFYATQCWLLIFRSEIAPPKITKPGEIGDCKWMTEEEAKNKLSESKYFMLLKAKMLASRY